MKSVSVVAARTFGFAGKSGVQFLLVASVVAICGLALGDRLAHLEMSAIAASFAATPIIAVVAAAFFTLLSHLAVSAYDPLVWPLLGDKVNRRSAMKSGFTAVSIGQTTGFGPVVGAFTRYRMLSGQGVSPLDAAKATALVAFGFVFGLTGALSGLFLLRPEAAATVTGWTPLQVSSAAAAALSLWMVSAGLIARRRSLTLRGATIPTPRGRTLLSFAVLALADVGFAAAALWMLLPADAAISFDAVLLAFAIALTFGIISNAPGGVGVFEVTLIMLLPMVDAATLVAVIILFRAVYYGAPFVIGALLLAGKEVGGFKPVFPRREAAPEPVDGFMVERAVRTSDRAEASLAYLGDKQFLFSDDGAAFIMYAKSRGVLVAMGDPVGPRRYWPELVDAFIAKATAEHVAIAFHKAGATTTALCRSRGLAADKFGHEAEIDLLSYDIGDRSRRQLRRKIKQARKAGVEITRYEPGMAPIAALRRISDDWLASKGCQDSGFSRGAFTAAYLRRFPVFVAEIDGAPVAFVSVWRSGDGSEWSVDLMRGDEAAPMGAMQALIAETIEAAKAAGAKRYNLCMAPMTGLEDAERPLEQAFAWLYAKHDKHGLQGLSRFKASFAPDWRPRYLVHQGGVRTAMTLFAISSLATKQMRPVAETPAPALEFEEAVIASG